MTTRPTVTFAAMLVRAQRRFAALSRPQPRPVRPAPERSAPAFLHAATPALPGAK